MKLILLALVMAGSQPSAGWKIGIASVEITPTKLLPGKPLWLAGYAARRRPADGTIHPLWVKAVALEDASGQVGVLVTSDHLGFPRWMSNRIWEQARQRYQLDRARILLGASHTHCGPVLARSLEVMYPLDASAKTAVEEYSEKLIAEVIKVIGSALAARAPAELAFGTGTCRFAVNRRNNPEPQVPKLRDEDKLRGPFDHSVPVLVIRRQGTVTGLIFGYACHNTTLDFQQWCGDYAGFAQIQLEQTFPGAKAMFFAGCGGDQNPLPRRKLELCARYGKELATAAAAAVPEARPLAPTLEIQGTDLELAYGPPPSVPVLEGMTLERNYRGDWARRQLADRRSGKPAPSSYPYPVVVWRLGGTIWWVALGGEVVVDFAIRLKRELGSDVIVQAYVNDLMAYIPSLRVLREGGYEGSTAMVEYDLPTLHWSDQVEEQIVGAVKDLASRIDAKP